MSDGHIPVNASDLPINVPALEESAIYDVVLKRVILNPTRSHPKDGSQGLIFCRLQTEVISGDFEGAFLPLNYLPLPIPIVGTKGEQFKATRASVPFGRFCRSFKITSMVPPVDITNAESMQLWQDWISQYYESQGKVSIRNQEFPEGTGKLSSGISDFIF